jgi:hypothetical protein
MSRRQQQGRQVVKVVKVNLTLPCEAYELIRQFSPTRRGYGDFLSRLLFEHAARVEERQRLRQELMAAVGPDEAA